MKSWILTLCFLGLLAGLAELAAASIVYQDTTGDNGNFIPPVSDPTANRPIGPINGANLPWMGNQITLAGTDRLLSTGAAIVNVGGNVVNLGPFNFEVVLYRNDGIGGQPGSIIASSLPNSFTYSTGVQTATFDFAPVAVPNGFTAVLEQIPPPADGTFFSGVIGPASTGAVPSIGGGINGIWYGDGTPGNWVFNTSWATNDGATTNFINLTINASPIPVPEPSSLILCGLGAAGLFIAARRGRKA